MTQHYVNVCGFRPFCFFVFFQSQLANILAVQSLAKEFLEDKVTTYFDLPQTIASENSKAIL